MNNELAMRTLAYLITHYKEHDKTIINLEEIQAIEFLQQENQELKEVIDKIKKAVDECWYMDSENVGEQIFLKKCELKDILNEVE